MNVYHTGYGNTIYFEDFKELFVIDRDFRRMYLGGRKKVESAPDGLYKMNITMDYKGFIPFAPLESDAVPGYEESPEKAHRHDSCWEDDFNCTPGYIVNPSLILYGDQISLADSEDKSYPWWGFSETDLYLLVTAIDSYRHRAIGPYGWKEIEDVPYNYKGVVLSRNVRILLDDWLKERDYRNRYNNIRYLPCQRMDREIATAYYKSLKRNKN